MDEQILAELQKVNAQLAKMTELLRLQAAPQVRTGDSRNATTVNSIGDEVRQKIEAARREASAKAADGGLGGMTGIAGRTGAF